MSPFSWKSRSTTSSFSTLRWCRISRAASSVVPTGTVMRFSRVITSAIARLTFVSNRRSRFVRMPTSRPSLLPSSVIGTPEMRYFFISSSASSIRLVGESVIGSTIMPLSDRLTRSTSDACSAIDRFLWITPSPPCCAIAIARRDSVTVSIAALTSGTHRRMFRVSRVVTSTCVGTTFECRGTSRTSSKVRAVARPVSVERRVGISVFSSIRRNHEHHENTKNMSGFVCVLSRLSS